MNKLSLISIDINSGTPNEFIDEIASIAVKKKSQYVCVANVHMLIEAHKDHAFANIINNANVITPDGMPLTWAIWLLHRIKQDRVAGMDLLPALLKKASNLQLPVFFYGGTEEMMTRTREHLKFHFPDIKLAGTYSPPFRKLTQEEDENVIQMINNSNAALVFVVLGCPKQERWMSAMHRKINAVMIGIGGALPVMINMQKRAPKWMQQLGLEWFFRLMLEPKRLFKRYAVSNSTFFYLIILELYRKMRNMTPYKI